MQFEGEVQVCRDAFHPLTADTITDEQIDALWREACGPGSHRLADTDTMHLCNVAVNARGYFTVREQAEARARCAEILERGRS
jgi:hypothetical protein